MRLFFSPARSAGGFSALFLLTTFSFFSERVHAEYNSNIREKYNRLYGFRYGNDETPVYYVSKDKQLPNKDTNIFYIQEKRTYTVQDYENQIYKIYFRESIFDLDKSFEKMASECGLKIIPYMYSADISPIIFWAAPPLSTMAIESFLEQTGHGYVYKLDFNWDINYDLIDCLDKQWNMYYSDSDSISSINYYSGSLLFPQVMLLCFAVFFRYRGYDGDIIIEKRNGIEDAFQALQQALQNKLDVEQHSTYRSELTRYKNNLEKYGEILGCPISAEVMEHPISVNTGRTYNKASLLKYAKEAGFKGLCPYTRLPIEGNISRMEENRVIKTIITKVLAHFTREIHSLIAQVPQFDKDYYAYQLSLTKKLKNDLLQTLTCPRTGVVFTDPIATNEGDTYEKSALGSATTRRPVAVIQELIRHTKSLSEKDEVLLTKNWREANINNREVNIGKMEMFFQRNKTVYMENEVQEDTPIELNQSGMYYTT